MSSWRAVRADRARCTRRPPARSRAGRRQRRRAPDCSSAGRSADALETLLRDYLRIRSSCARIRALARHPGRPYLRLGGRREHGLLGAGATVGAATWQASHSRSSWSWARSTARSLRRLPARHARPRTAAGPDAALYQRQSGLAAAHLVKRECSRCHARQRRVGWTRLAGGKSAVADEVVLQGDALRAAAPERSRNRQLENWKWQTSVVRHSLAS
jgi:hypothetical protein